MDRIRRALDMAREDKRREQPAAQRDLPRPQWTAVKQGPIVYSHTRVVAPDATALESHRIVDSAANTPAAAAYRLLRTQVLQRMREHGWRSLAVLSPGAHDGKTTTAINLAVSLAQDMRHTVLLVDFDLKRPGVAQAFGLTPEHGVEEVLQGAVGVQSCLLHPQGFDRLVVLPAKSPLARSAEYLSGPAGRDLVSDLRNRYPERLIIVDLPPLLGTDDALAFIPLIECALVVASEGSTRRADMRRCMELLHRVPVVGTILNRATLSNAAYG